MTNYNVPNKKPDDKNNKNVQNTDGDWTAGEVVGGIFKGIGIAALVAITAGLALIAIIMKVVCIGTFFGGN